MFIKERSQSEENEERKWKKSKEKSRIEKRCRERHG
jgi:hypothetical protein